MTYISRQRTNSSVPIELRYKYCFVSRCKSTTVNTPEKRFFCVPRANLKFRDKWFAACRGCSSNLTSANTIFYCCEDHFNAKTDYANLMEHRLMGTKLNLKRDVIPSIFSWKEHRLRPTNMRGTQSKQKSLPKRQRKVADSVPLSQQKSKSKPHTTSSEKVDEIEILLNPAEFSVQQLSQDFEETTFSESIKVEDMHVPGSALNKESLAHHHSLQSAETTSSELKNVQEKQDLNSAENNRFLVHQHIRNMDEITSQLKIVKEEQILSTEEIDGSLAHQYIEKEETDFKNLMQHRLMGEKLHLKQDAVPSVLNWREPIEEEMKQTNNSLDLTQNNKEVETITNSDITTVSRVQIYPQILPHSFKNVIIEEDEEKVTIRSSIQGMQDIKTWMNQFEDATYTKWNTRNTIPSAKRLVCKKRYLCHHSAKNKLKASEVNRRASKNSGCEAKLNIIVKLTSKSTKRRDRYVKDGLPAVITIDVQHNHSLDSTEALRFLPPSETTKEKFLEYFNAGMGYIKAKEYHESYLMLKKNFTEKDLTCGSLNPKMRAIREWYQKWKLQSLKSKLENNTVENLPKEFISNNQAEVDSAWETKLLSAMSCEQIPVVETNLQIPAIEIKQEPMEDSKISAIQNKMNISHPDPPTNEAGNSLLQPPVLIKQEIISSDEEL